jgi:hypothetical protein
VGGKVIAELDLGDWMAALSQFMGAAVGAFASVWVWYKSAESEKNRRVSEASENKDRIREMTIASLDSLRRDLQYALDNVEEIISSRELGQTASKEQMKIDFVRVSSALEIPWPRLLQKFPATTDIFNASEFLAIASIESEHNRFTTQIEKVTTSGIDLSDEALNMVQERVVRLLDYIDKSGFV